MPQGLNLEPAAAVLTTSIARNTGEKDSLAGFHCLPKRLDVHKDYEDLPKATEISLKKEISSISLH